MSSSEVDAAAPIDWNMAAQGDILDVDCLMYWDGRSDQLECLSTPSGVMLVSQTCDVVQASSKERLLVAPIVECAEEELSQVRKGRKPLLVLAGEDRNAVASLERITSVPRKALASARIVDRSGGEQSGSRASELAAQIGRAFSRFAFPNEVHNALDKLHRKVSRGYFKDTKFAEVLSYIEEFRVACDDWNKPGRTLKTYVIVPSDFLPSADTQPLGWRWSDDTVTGLKAGSRPDQLSIDAISELIVKNVAAANENALVKLWSLWGESLRTGYLSNTDEEVSSIQLEVLSTTEFTYDMYKSSETLDYSALSFQDSAAASPS